jgi:uncharacterized protein YndB with AHSA1/START domain
MKILSDSLRDPKMRVAQSQHGKRLGGRGQRENDASSSLATAPIVKEIYIEASTRTVLEFLTDEKKIQRWLTDSVMRLSVTADSKLRVRFKGEEIQSVSMTILVDGARAGAFLPRNTILGENSWAQSSVIEIELRPEGSGTALKLIHTHLGRS